MATLYEIAVLAKNQTKDHNNIFHFLDDNDNADLSDVADYIEGFFCTPMAPLLTDQFTYNKIEIQSLSAGNPGQFQKTISITGTLASDPMPTGVHINIKLGSADQGLRAGNKLQGGLTEPSFVNGNATDGILDLIQVVYEGVLFGSNTAVGIVMAIFRPTFSFPGIPAFSLVQSILVRGNSTNNRRHEDFQR